MNFVLQVAFGTSDTKFIMDIQKQKIVSGVDYENGFNAILKNCRDGIPITARDGLILSANSASCKNLDRSESEIIRVVASEYLNFDGELCSIFIISDKSNEKKPETPLYINENKNRAIVVTAIPNDITERKKIEVPTEKYRKLISDETFV